MKNWDHELIHDIHEIFLLIMWQNQCANDKQSPVWIYCWLYRNTKAFRLRKGQGRPNWAQAASLLHWVWRKILGFEVQKDHGFFLGDSHTKPGKWTLKEMVFSWKNRVFSQFSMSRWILWAGKTPSHLSNCESTTFGKPIWIHTSSDLKPWPRTGYRTLTVESSQDPIWSTSNLCPAQLRFC